MICLHFLHLIIIKTRRKKRKKKKDDTSKMMTLLQEGHENSRSHADFTVDVNAQVYFCFLIMHQLFSYMGNKFFEIQKKCSCDVDS